MPQFAVPVNLGLNTSIDATLLAPGFLRLASGWVYSPDDPDRLHKMWGNTVAEASLPTTTDPKGIQFTQFKRTNAAIFYAADGRLFWADAAESIGAWTEVLDQQGTPAAFDWGSGNYFKALTDGRNRWIMWTGDATERPLVIDEDRNARFLGMKSPGIMDYPTSGTESSALLTSVAVPINPDSNALPGSVVGTTKTITAFTDPELAYDDNLSTYALASDNDDTLIYAVNYEFADAGQTNDHVLIVIMEGVYGVNTSSRPGFGAFTRPLEPDGEPGVTFSVPSVSNTGSGQGTATVRVSEDNGSTFTIHYVGSVKGIVGNPIQIELTDSINWTDIIVQITFEYTGGIYNAGLRIVELFAQ